MFCHVQPISNSSFQNLNFKTIWLLEAGNSPCDCNQYSYNYFMNQNCSISIWSVEIDFLAFIAIWESGLYFSGFFMIVY